MKNSYFSRFTPKEPKFFPLLKEMSGVILSASELNIENVEQYDYQRAIHYFKAIKEQEKLGDEISNRIYDELNATFITPFDRQDILLLANTLDNVTDYINSCAKRIVYYKPSYLPSCTLELAKLIQEAALTLDLAIDELDVLKKDAAKIKAYCKDLHTIENKADDVYDTFIITLFGQEKDSIEIVKLMDILQELEKATNAAESVGKIIRTIIIKYA